MLFAIILVCAVEDSPCTLENAVWKVESDSVFTNEEVCLSNAKEYFHTQLNKLMNMLEKHKRYELSIECKEDPGEPA